MWLTGFDAPCLHTMYVDKPMQGHGLMQAIARVNRVFRDKPGGLVVDYLGLADQLKKALHTYTESGGQGETALDQEEAVALMLARYEVCCGIFHGFDWGHGPRAPRRSASRCCPRRRSTCSPRTSGKERLLQAVTELSKRLRAVGAARRGDPHPRRRRVLPGGARGDRQDQDERPKGSGDSTTPSGRSSRRHRERLR
jgi:type I restriction enzyme R subunit